MILEAILPALLPVASDGIRGLINKFTGGAGAKPANVEEAISLMEAETKRLEALAKIDAPATNVSTWVNNVRGIQRPTVSAIIIIGYIAALSFSMDADLVSQLGAYAQMVTFYLFGDRTYMHFKKK